MLFSRSPFIALLVAASLLVACDKKQGSSNSAPPTSASDLSVVLTAGLNAFEQGAVKDALAQFEKAAAMRPAQYEVQLNLANTQLRNDQPEPAMASAEAALRLNKDS